MKSKDLELKKEIIFDISCLLESCPLIFSLIVYRELMHCAKLLESEHPEDRKYFELQDYTDFQSIGIVIHSVN